MHSPSLTVLIPDEPPLAAQISIGQQSPLIAVLTADYAEPLRVVISPVVITIGDGGGGTTGSSFLLEGGGYLLLESGDRILLES